MVQYLATSLTIIQKEILRGRSEAGIEAVLINPDDAPIAVDVMTLHTAYRAIHHEHSPAEADLLACELHSNGANMCRTITDTVNVRSTSHNQIPFEKRLKKRICFIPVDLSISTI